jgi:multimeric flavodoxin WrbA
MKIVALSCTQRRQSSRTDAVLDIAARGVLHEAPDAEIATIRLIDHEIKLCQGEDTCLDPNVGYCPLDDDFHHVVDQAAGASGMILALPTYGGNVPAILKIFQERLKSFMLWADRPFGRLPACTIVHARKMMTESALGALAPWYTRLQIDNVVSVTFTHSQHPDLARTAIPDLCHAAGRQLARAVLGPAASAPMPSPLRPSALRLNGTCHDPGDTTVVELPRPVKPSPLADQPWPSSGREPVAGWQ